MRRGLETGFRHIYMDEKGETLDYGEGAVCGFPRQFPLPTYRFERLVRVTSRREHIARLSQLKAQRLVFVVLRLFCCL